MAFFRTKARAIDLLGKNQIADLPTAITELWKNGYDAYGDYLDASLYRAGFKEVQHVLFTICDDGHGMSQDDIINKWIVIGTDSKRNEARITSEEDRFDKNIRVPLGEKGIGRLSVSYLGNHMLMITKKKNLKAQMLFMNWAVLSNYELFLDDVEIPTEEIGDMISIDETYSQLLSDYLKNFNHDSWANFDELKKSILADLENFAHIPNCILDAIVEHFKKYGHGTFFVVFDPIEELSKLGEDNKNDIDDEQEVIAEHKKYVRSALSGLFNPFDCTLMKQRKEIMGDECLNSPSFFVYSQDGTSYDFLDLKGFYTEEDFDKCEHWIDGTIDINGVFKGKIKIFGDIEEYAFVQRQKPKALIGPLSIRLAFWEGRKSNSSMSEELWNYYDDKGENFSGLYIYRDGFRVLPYGRTDFDFLEFEKNRSKNAGTYYFSHRKMFGYIGITKKNNPELIDKSGREGFVANDSYRELKRLLMGFFKKIAADKYGTYAEPRKQHRGELEKEKERLNIINEEKKKNYQTVVALRERVRGNNIELEKEVSEVQQIQKSAKDFFVFENETDDGAAKQLISRIDIALKEIETLRLYIPSGLSLYGFDSVMDEFADFDEKCVRLEDSLREILVKMNRSVKMRTLVDRYTNRYENLLEDLHNESDVVLRSVNDALNGIYECIRREIKSRNEKMESFWIDSNELSVMSPEKIQQSLFDMDSYYRDCISYTKISIKPMVEHLADINSNTNWSEILTAYKSKEAELSHKLDVFYELSQVGMAIEIIDHQFNVVYAQIRKSIAGIERGYTDKEFQENYSSLKMSFQHLETNHKMLTPLYRTSLRNRHIVKGEEIGKTILQFYGDLFEKNDISFEMTERFKAYEYETFDSIIMPVFLNVVNNAIYWVEFAVTKKVIRIDVKNDNVLILDSGSKMSHTELTRCFELFYTRKLSNSGRGIGLYLARKCLNSVDMDITATNDPELNYLNGACFVISVNEGGLL
jgi:signal transduction histidine kinase